MKNLYVIGKGEPFQLGNDVEPIVGGFDLSGFDESLSLDLEEPGGKKRVEQRCHQRLPDDIPGSSFEMRQVRLQFQNLSVFQQARLYEFLLNHGSEIDEVGVND